MAESTVTQTGRDELVRAVHALPERVTAACRAVAGRIAVRIQAGARQRLIAQLQTSRRGLADAITVKEDLANQQFLVESSAPRGQAANVPIWIEHGTVKMAARPYMRPAAAAEQENYRREMETAVVAEARQVFGE